MKNKQSISLSKQNRSDDFDASLQGEQIDSEHDAHCGCGHEHHHEEHGMPEHSAVDEHCGCGHEYHHEEHDAHEHSHSSMEDLSFHIPDTKAEKHIYILENLDCANCAAKIEKKLNELPEIEYASVTYATRQLRVAADRQDALLSKISDICRSIEPDITVTPQEKRPAAVRHETSQVKGLSEEQRDSVCILAGAALFILGFAFKKASPDVSNILFLLSYLVLGAQIIWTAVRNITRGNIFDENFLMSIATIGAICIGDFAEACGVMLFYRVGEWFEHKAVSRSRSQIMDALDLRPETVSLVTDSGTRVIPAEDARPGDILLVRAGDRIPLDGTVTDGESRIDTSPVTGEPVPVKAVKGSQVISGCMNTSGVLHMRVDKVLGESMVTKILDSVENAAASKPKIDRFITRFARIYTPFVVIAAVATAIIPSLITGNWSYWVYTALTFLVISCPCALVLSVPLAFFSGIGAGSKKGILFKGGASLEALKSIKAVVMDKTGTITKGNFVLQDVLPSQAFHTSDGSTQEEARSALLSLAASCESASSHPIAVSILEAAGEKKISYIKPQSIEEVSGHGILAVIAGDTVLCGNGKLMQDNGVDLADYRTSQYGTEVLIAVNGIWAGQLLIADTLKEDAVSAIHTLKRQNIVTAMLTGDAEDSAKAVAIQTGIDEVHAKLLPEDKLNRLKQIREAHGEVMFVGDGINDAPVLAGADVGAAMGSGADAAIEAADVVFMTSSMSAIPESIRIARTTGRIAIQNVTFALVIKAIVMILGLTGGASMWFAVFADSGVAMLCVLNSIRILYHQNKQI